ncbi:MAG: CBS domain-containing protein [Magnetospirillum sp.]|nr:CBS domain-containing protein [Magnetospirillum sp.]
MNSEMIVSPVAAPLHPDDAIADALESLSRQGVATLPVVDGDCRFIGAFGLREIIGMLLPRAALLETGLDLSFIGDSLAQLGDRLGRLAGDSVGAHMSPHRTIPIRTALVETLLLLYRGDSWLPVVDDAGKLVGVVTAADALSRISDAV